METELSWGELLGCGGFGQVHAATWQGKKLAIKSSLPCKPSAFGILEAEECALQHLAGCDHIVSMFGSAVSVDDNGNPVYHLIIERLDGDLEGYIKRGGGRVKEDQARHFARVITEGLAFIHSKGYVHCDIKPENLLLTVEDVNSPLRSVKIADFGLAKKVGRNVGRRGTLPYMSPEAKKGDCEPPMDIWSLGCVMVEMLADEIPESAEDFIEHCLDSNPETRWTAERLLRHPFLDTTTTCSIPPACCKFDGPIDSSKLLFGEKGRENTAAHEIICISDEASETSKKIKDEGGLEHIDMSRKKRKIEAQSPPPKKARKNVAKPQLGRHYGVALLVS